MKNNEILNACIYYNKNKNSINNYDYGYICGGFVESFIILTIDRIQFPFDYGSLKFLGNLYAHRDLFSGCNSSNYGYICGGYHTNKVEKIHFPFNGHTTSWAGELINRSIYYTSSCNSSNYGYVFGGDDKYNHVNISTIERFLFPFDGAKATYFSKISSAKNGTSACNSSNYGYVFGGYDSDMTSTIERLQFSFDSTPSQVVGHLDSEFFVSSACNSSDYGYVFGGKFSGCCLSTINRIQFSFNSGDSNHVGNLSDTKYATASCNSSNYGYIAGGKILNGSETESYSTVERITFPFNSGIANKISNLSSSRHYSVFIDETDFNTLF